jgi:hypothetical protein
VLIVGVISYVKGAEAEIERRVEQTCIELHTEDRIADITRRVKGYLAGKEFRFECWVDVIFNRPFQSQTVVWVPLVPRIDFFRIAPREPIEKILWLAIRTQRDRASLSMVCSEWRRFVGTIGVVDQLWYGLRAPERLRSFVTPDELGLIQTGELQEGPCETMAGAAFAYLRDKYMGAKGFRSMLGVLYAANGVVLITFSGKLSSRKPEGVAKRAALEAINTHVFKGQAVIVYAGAAGAIVGKTKLVGDSVLDFAGDCLPHDLLPVGKTPLGEVVDTIPGTCALPKLIMHCQAKGLVPRWASEKLFDMSDKPISIEGPGNRLVPFWPGHSVPSCGNCRILVPLMLNGVKDYANNEIKRREAQERHRAAWEEYQQFLEEESRTEEEARLMLARSAFTALLHKLGDDGTVIDTKMIFKVPGIAKRVSQLQQFMSARQLGANIALTFFDIFDHHLFEMLFAEWRKQSDTVKKPPPETEQRETFSSAHPGLSGLLKLVNDPDSDLFVDWERFAELQRQAMEETVVDSPKRLKRKDC